MNPRGFIAYRGPSRLGSGPIVVIVTLSSLNTKTGDMAQAWVLRSDASPNDAIVAGGDQAICGHCVHRSDDGATGRSCYVSWWQGPTQVYKAFTRGHYPDVDLAEGSRLLQGAMVRLAAYGDPAAVAVELWRTLLVHTKGWTGYTHQWRTCDQRFRAFTMASVESPGEVDQAHALGWRTFRTRLASETVRPADEIVCPASDEAGHRTTCAACGLCVGRTRETARSVAIIAHGQRVGWLAEKKAVVETVRA